MPLLRKHFECRQIIHLPAAAAAAAAKA